MTGCGWTPDEVSAACWADVNDLLAYWQKSPPTHEAIALAYGIKPKDTAVSSVPPLAPNSADPSGIGGLIAMFPSGVVPATR